METTKTYNGFYGYTYFYVGDVLCAVPTNADGSADIDDEAQIIEVADFVEPLTVIELEIVKLNLK